MTTTQAATAADEAIMAISQTIEGTERMEKRVEALLTQSKSPNAVWATWMGAELEQMHPDMWDQCRDATYNVIHVWKAHSNDIRQWELAQQQPEGVYPTPSTSSAPPQQLIQLPLAPQRYSNLSMSQPPSSGFQTYTAPAGSTHSSTSLADMKWNSSLFDNLGGQGWCSG